MPTGGLVTTCSAVPLVLAPTIAAPHGAKPQAKDQNVDNLPFSSASPKDGSPSVFPSAACLPCCRSPNHAEGHLHQSRKQGPHPGPAMGCWLADSNINSSTESYINNTKIASKINKKKNRHNHDDNNVVKERTKVGER